MSNNKEQAPEKNSGQGSQPASHPLDRYTVQPRQDGDDKKSPFYQSSAPVLSLPKGGGALKGIDEKFSVNAVNGTAGLEVPLPLSPGRGGFGPGLSVSYNSGSGNGPFGLGWSLGLPSIRRKTDKKLPAYQDDKESDVFLMAGAEDLVSLLDTSGQPVATDKVNGAYRVKAYRPRIEGLFARIEHISRKGSSDSWWRVTTKDNVSTWYGLNPEGRLADPEAAARIFEWLPQLSTDHKGNVILYRYIAEDLRGVPAQLYEKNRLNGTAPFANTYLKRALYSNREAWYVAPANPYEPQLPTEAAFLMEAVLDYGDHSSPHQGAADRDWPARSDAFSDFHAGFEIRTYRKCKRVMMYHHFEELGDARLVRSLELGYKQDGKSSLVEADLLLTATQRGYQYDTYHEAWQDKALPAMTFNYEPLKWSNEVQQVSAADFRHAPQGLSGPYQWTDFDGEGISGILSEQGGGWWYKNNLGKGQFTPARNIAPRPSFSGLGQALQWQDLDADGRRQVVAQGTVNGYWELDDDPSTSSGQAPSAGSGQAQQWQSFRQFSSQLNIDWNSPFNKMLDLDGDGRPDLLVTEDRAWTWYHNEGKAGYSTGGYSPLFHDEEKGPQLLLRDTVQSIFLADMNGDGLTDLVRIRNGEICYWPNKGYGRFGAKVSMAGAPLFDTPDGYNPLYLSLADISGTGAADLIYLGDDRCLAWINLCGNGWGEAQEISPLPGTDNQSKLAVLDFLGNGTGCLVWSSPLPRYSNAPLQYIDLMGGNKPYLMRRYDNGMGKSVSVTYKSSTQFYLDDKLVGRPWATRLPFPVHCIETVTTSDEVSETTFSQSYRYRHGYYDHEEREFRGFGYVETVDIDRAIVSEIAALDQAPVLTKTWNHTGAWLREKSLTEAFQQEYFYFAEWDEAVLVAHLPGELNPQELREAHRALKGLPLRQEVYALDGSGRERIPYAVTASAYKVQLVQPAGPNRYASFISLKQQSLAFASEREMDDPRVQQELTLETDEYGHVLRSAQVAYPRKRVPETSAIYTGIVKEAQQRMHVTCSENGFTNDVVTDSHYRLRAGYTGSSHELGGYQAPAGLWTPEALLGLVLGAEEIAYTETFNDDLLQKRLLSQQLSLFQSDTAEGAPLAAGQQQTLALPYQSYTRVFSAGDLDRLYGPGRIDEDHDLAAAGFTDVQPGGMQRYWIPSGTVQYKDTLYAYPAQQFYTPLSYTDPWGQETRVQYWQSPGGQAYWLVPRQTEDALQNTATVDDYDWRLLQPRQLTDANGNISELLYDALGMPVAMALRGKGNEGDSLFDGARPSPDLYDFADVEAQDLFFDEDPEANASLLLGKATWRCVYRLDRLPLSVGMIARTGHVADTGTEPVEVLIRLSYTDGFGRLIMHKAQRQTHGPEDRQHWTGTGRTVYNNKGKAVMQYEPYLSASHESDTAEQAAAQGISPQMHYDALGRVERTDMPDGSFSKTTWTAWEQTVWDANDTVKDSAWYAQRTGLPASDPERIAAEKAAAHDDTPAIMHTDSLARPFYTIQILQAGPSIAAPLDAIHSHVRLDIQGNRLSVTDGLGRETLRYHYNMLQQPCNQQSIDSGSAYTFTDAAGQPLLHWDADGRRFETGYDVLRRPLTQTVEHNGNTLLLEYTTYGEVYDPAGAASQNLRGQVYEHFDSSGRQWMPEGYDFKANPVKASLSLLQDREATDVDWNAAPLLESKVYTTNTKVDALNRPVQTIDPGANVSTFGYDKGGALRQVRLNGKDYVKDIHYNAKGQREAIWYDNKTKSRYHYEPLTYRLSRLYTITLDETNSYYGKSLQDLNYTYDPTGNITRISDQAQKTIFYNNSIIEPEQDFTYDALYRLIEASGREQDTNNDPPFGAGDRWTDMPAHNNPDSNTSRRYTQYYSYDKVGNIGQLRHSAGTGSYTRNYNNDSDSNRLRNTEIGATTYDYRYDSRGNMIEMHNLQQLQWNALNQLQFVAQGTTRAWYQYSGGQRIRKYVSKGNLQEERIYLGSFEIYRKFDTSSLTNPIVERTTVHISDDTGRMAMLETRTIGTAAADNDTLTELTRYIYSNHLQSASLELDEAGAIISYEEYHPYGTSAYQAKSSTIKATAKRYRYTGKERDEESGLYYHGARYYIPWLCRWSAVDPLESKYAGKSPYNYSFNNPVMFNDPSGRDGEKAIPAPKDELTGESIKYTYVFNSIDADGNITSNSTSSTEDVPGVAHGIYTRTRKETLSGDPKVVKDGNTSYVTMYDYQYKESFVPYQKESFSENLWNIYKAREPITAGAINGTWNFASGMVEGLWNLAVHPDEVAIGIATLAYYTDFNSPGRLTPEGMEYNAQLASGLEGGWNKFKTGDAYTKTSMLTEAGLTIGSFFIGGEGGGGGRLSAEGGAARRLYIPYTPKGELIELPQQIVKGVDIPIPDANALGYPHTTLGGRVGSDGVIYRQSATFTGESWPKAAGKDVPWSRVDWSDHGTPWHHQYNPHQHIFYYDNINKAWKYNEGSPFPY
ncbi:SpvB/TcaC N-terminal domain-containing protein [Taibaiella koreensis]|uniref:SpvB/TcaC N-terminal domain-containing protein n=1 Tax=Taibaiella koreensis TaxID=1268548 RepID=UPI0013C35354|nr:SpvB/TcaC N-terminal domain-containing protein [Taibaiella koreensis]